MEGRAAPLRVGLLILFGIALLLGLVWFLRGGQVNGVRRSSPTSRNPCRGCRSALRWSTRGVTVGRVTQVGVVSAAHGTAQQGVVDPLYRQVYVNYVVDTTRIGHFPDVDVAVKLGLRARLNSQFITGLSYIDLDFVDPVRYPVPALPWEPEAEFVPSIPSAFAEVRNAGQQLLAKMDKVDVTALAGSLTTLSQKFLIGSCPTATCIRLWRRPPAC